MKTKIQNLLRPSGILVLLFLVFIFYVGLASFPDVVSRTQGILKGQGKPPQLHPADQ